MRFFGYCERACRGGTCRDERCLSRHISAKALDTLIWDDLRALLAHLESIAYTWNALGVDSGCLLRTCKSIVSIRRGQVRLEGQIERLTQAYLTP